MAEQADYIAELIPRAVGMMVGEAELSQFVDRLNGPSEIPAEGAEASRSAMFISAEIDNNW